MNLIIDSLAFLWFLIALPFILFTIGQRLHVRGKKGGYRWQTLANAFFFLASGHSLIIIFLTIGGSWGWNLLFHEPLALIFWISFLVSPLILIYLTKDDSSSVNFMSFTGTFGCTLAIVLVGTFIVFLTMAPISESFGGIIQSFQK